MITPFYYNFSRENTMIYRVNNKESEVYKLLTEFKEYINQLTQFIDSVAKEYDLPKDALGITIDTGRISVLEEEYKRIPVEKHNLFNKVKTGNSALSNSEYRFYELRLTKTIKDLFSSVVKLDLENINQRFSVLTKSDKETLIFVQQHENGDFYLESPVALDNDVFLEVSVEEYRQEFLKN